jgi:tetratricopeptide (TPR) repeat protein
MKSKALTKILLSLLAVIFSLQLTVKADGFSTLLPQDKTQKYGEDSVSCVINISLYREFLKQWKASDYNSPVIKDIISPWRWVFQNCPMASENTYVDGVKIMQYRIENEKDPINKGKLIDTLMMVYDQRIQYFPNHFKSGRPQQGAILGRKGVDLSTYDQERYVDTYEILKQSVDIDGDDSDGTVLIYYFRSVIKMARKAKLDSAMIVDVYDQVIDILDHNIVKLNKAGDTKWVENYKNFKGNIDATFEPFASCPDLVRIYGNKMNKHPEDTDLLKKITNLLDRRSCQEDPLYLKASVQLHKLEPSPESAYNIGRLLLKEEKYSEAINYFEEASKSEDIDKSHNAYKYLAESLRAVKNYPRARQMALKAIEIKPNDGAPYITIGDMYAASAKDCGNNEFTSRVAYWAAVDKYNQAKRVDESQAESANKRIATYSVYFPSLETIFFHGFEEGKSYTIDCWFKEETTVRASK